VNKDLFFSSESSEWSTPQYLFDLLDAKYHFELDVCATAENAKCGTYFTKENNGLALPWTPRRCWMNPPYGRGISKWIAKAYNESLRGALVVCLLPSRTDTAWWHDYVLHGEVAFLRGRLKFSGHQNAAPFPSAIVVFGGENADVAGA
jgi:phage N-6-adenine-methyltransferase